MKRDRRGSERQADRDRSNSRDEKKGSHDHDSIASPGATLQRRIGNQAVGALHDRRGGNTPLEVSSPRDPAENEADRVAEKVVSPGGRLKPESAAKNDRLASASDANHSNGGKLLRQQESNQNTPTSIGDRGTAGQHSDTTVGRAIRRRGNPLSTEIRSEFESKIGANFGNVRVHTGPAANDAAQSINAKAFTVGNHIAFSRGEFRPASDSGKKLLAHELTHVHQQSNGVMRPGTVARQVTGHGDHEFTQQADGTWIESPSSQRSQTRLDPKPGEAQEIIATVQQFQYIAELCSEIKQGVREISQSIGEEYPPTTPGVKEKLAKVRSDVREASFQWQTATARRGYKKLDYAYESADRSEGQMTHIDEFTTEEGLARRGNFQYWNEFDEIGEGITRPSGVKAHFDELEAEIHKTVVEVFETVANLGTRYHGNAIIGSEFEVDDEVYNHDLRGLYAYLDAEYGTLKEFISVIHTVNHNGGYDPENVQRMVYSVNQARVSESGPYKNVPDELWLRYEPLLTQFRGHRWIYLFHNILEMINNSDASAYLASVTNLMRRNEAGDDRYREEHAYARKDAEGRLEEEEPEIEVEGKETVNLPNISSYGSESQIFLQSLRTATMTTPMGPVINTILTAREIAIGAGITTAVGVSLSGSIGGGVVSFGSGLAFGPNGEIGGYGSFAPGVSAGTSILTGGAEATNDFTAIDGAFSEIDGKADVISISGYSPWTIGGSFGAIFEHQKTLFSHHYMGVIVGIGVGLPGVDVALQEERTELLFDLEEMGILEIE